MTDQGTESVEQQRPPREHPVDVGNGRLGVRIIDPGEEVGLGLLSGNSEIYLKTSSGNMYFLKKNREYPVVDITNANKSREEGKLHVDSEDIEEMGSRKIILGQRFDFGNGSPTSYVSEVIVIDNATIYDQKVLDQKTKGVRNPIVKNFIAACQPLLSEPQS